MRGQSVLFYLTRDSFRGGDIIKKWLIYIKKSRSIYLYVYPYWLFKVFINSKTHLHTREFLLCETFRCPSSNTFSNKESEKCLKKETKVKKDPKSFTKKKKINKIQGVELNNYYYRCWIIWCDRARCCFYHWAMRQLN